MGCQLTSLFQLTQLWINKWISEFKGGTLNPADCATGGSNINDIAGDSVLLTGPKFLYCNKAQWPQQPTIACVDTSDEEVKQIASNSLLVTD